MMIRSAPLPYVLVPACAVVLALLGVAQMAQLNPPLGPLGAGHGLPLLLCLYRPLAGAGLSLVLNPVLVELARTGDSGPLWTEAGLLGHLCVLAFAGWQLRPRRLLGLWCLTFAASLVLGLRGGFAEIEEMSALSAVVLIAAGALHSRGEAWRRLSEQLDINVTERRRRAVLEERSRIARELHDVLAHHMSVIAIQAEAAPYRVTDPPEPLVRGFTTIRTHAQDALDELRRVLGVLRADGAGLDPQPSLERLPELIAAAGDAGLAVVAEGTGEPATLPPGVSLSAYRIVQEGLNNVMRHAPGARVRVELSRRTGSLRLRIVNGPPAGAPGPESAGSGHGLLGMRERVEMMRGSLDAGATPEGGFRVEAVLPVRSA